MTVTLRIMSYQVTGLTPVHHYGVLRCPGQRPHRLERTIDAAEAERLNAYDNTPDMYRAGSTTERFNSADQVRARAQEVWREVYPDATEMEEVS